jgi:hypothetical protein
MMFEKYFAFAVAAIILAMPSPAETGKYVYYLFSVVTTQKAFCLFVGTRKSQ